MAASPGRSRDHRIAEEQAALRRVAVLVARAAPPGEVFAAVTEEVGRLLSADHAVHDIRPVRCLQHVDQAQAHSCHLPDR